ncbi:MAG: transcriptional repressor [Coriobacteriales bacterium]|jgi:Fur family ferric uptake transcriptional regulator|nr:transcriptional repressor [Coriobacteriales bacterium]
MSQVHYASKQREAILAFLSQVGDRHLTADQIAQTLAARGVTAARSTIYRQLALLVEAGRLRKYDTGERGSACYQYVATAESKDCRQHFHLRCEGCGRLLHLDCKELSGISQHVQQAHGFTIDSSRTVFYGLCADCAQGTSDSKGYANASNKAGAAA